MTGPDFFVSYAGPDRPWAEWVAAQLEAAHFTVELDIWDWAPADNTGLRRSNAIDHATRVVALYSKAYFERDRSATDEHGQRYLIPLRVQQVDLPEVLEPLACTDLFGLDERSTRTALLTAVGAVGTEPQQRTGSFTGKNATRSAGPRLPGTLPPIWNAPPANPSFTGREGQLAAVRERLRSGPVPVQALHGTGGVGKTQLAIQYAHLFAGDYTLVWWIDAEQTTLIGEQLATLAVQAGWSDAGTAAETAATAALDRLRHQPGWLLVFDNAPAANQIRRWLPDGPGHVIITSRSSNAIGVATPLEVGVFSRPESVALLHDHVPTLTDLEADGIATVLGDLPLAVIQAARLLAEIGMTSTEYLHELHDHVTELRNENKPVGYPYSLAAAIRMSIHHLTQQDTAILQLLRICATLAREPVPLTWFEYVPYGVLPEPLATTVCRSWEFRRVLRQLSERGLARVTTDTIQLHRLTWAAVYDQRTTQEQHDDRIASEQLLASAEPDDDGSDPTSWPEWAALLPHLLHLNPATSGETVRRAACTALGYLVMRGEAATARSLAETWHQAWQQTAGPDDKYVLWAASQLASTHLSLGHPEQARHIDKDVLARRRRTLGEDHPDTLAAAHNLAVDLSNLGEHEQARRLNEDVLARQRRVLGEGDPDTLRTAHSLANDLAELGDHEEARRLDEDVLARRRYLLGDDHPDTLSSAHNLLVDLTRLAESMDFGSRHMVRAQAHASTPQAGRWSRPRLEVGVADRTNDDVGEGAQARGRSAATPAPGAAPG